eukprot:GFUD01106580.1.p1 GENE.GFUD01106580.1~~GFUD01106580.1.p1  ORF type:complete len:446 (+),score=89.95 GFUD01106580.1:76-1413(+)
MSEDESLFIKALDLLGSGTSAISYSSTHLCLTDKKGFFNSILTSLSHSITLQSSCLTDLVLLCSGPDGLLPVSAHSAVLASQSPLLQNLLLSISDPVLLLPEVEVKTLWNMLDLLYTGRCELREKDVPKLFQLLTSLGLHGVVGTLEKGGVRCYEGRGLPVRTCLATSNSGPVGGMDLDRGKYSQDYPASPIYECKNCGVEFYESQQVEYEVHERKCIRKERMKKVANAQTMEVQASVADASNEPSYTSVIKTPTVKKQFTGRYCQMCGKKERNLYTLKVHYTNNHFFTEMASLITDKKSSQCEVCGQHFTDCENRFCNIVRHRGATHDEVVGFVQKECGSSDDRVACDRCQICGVKQENWKAKTLGHHLIQEHYKLKLQEMLSPGQDMCNICNSECKNIYGLIAHIGLTHGCAMKLYRDFLASKSLTTLKVERSKKPRFSQTST